MYLLLREAQFYRKIKWTKCALRESVYGIVRRGKQCLLQ